MAGYCEHCPSDGGPCITGHATPENAGERFPVPGAAAVAEALAARERELIAELARVRHDRARMEHLAGVS